RQSNRQNPETTSQAHQPTVLRSLHLLISGTGKYLDYSFYHVTGIPIPGKARGASERERPPVDLHSLLP
ncbi:hypothetical protein NO221_03130, partial [Gluconacetobacter entanii]|nr:hypothetical protein [Gluconacetobacter entanii]MCW4582765.1 hypothetical protein [Gluconacetobacter entanii]MCW4586196.1 hypothetical protein [Gluconacetobacter entanii]